MTALYIIFGVSLALAAVLHTLSVFLPRYARIPAYINIGLHIAIIAEHLYLSLSLEILAFVMLTSLLYYLVISLIKMKAAKGQGEAKK